MGVPQFRPDLSWLALQGADVIGLCINWIQPAANETLPNQGWIEAIGVIPSWWGKGVADVLMTRSLNRFLDQGFSQVALNVDTRNPTGALQLYEKHGFTPSKRTGIFEKALD